MIVTYMLFIILLVLFCIALIMTKDYLSPSCLVCESFIFAYLSAIFSSRAGGWTFNIHWNTVIIISIGIFCFLLGSMFVRKPRYTNNKEKKGSITPLKANGKFVNIILFIQIILLIIYVYYFKKSGSQFSNMDWNSMMRMRRLTVSYGDGLEINIPMIVSQSVKLAKANAYIALYYIMHNIAVRSFIKNYKLKHIKRLSLIVFFYLPFSILQAARFEVITLIIGGVIIWYVFYIKYSRIFNIKMKNMLKSVRRLIIVLVMLLILMSVLGVIVGREASNSLFAEGFNYMGRTIQAFDYFVQNYNFNISGSLNKNETFYGVFKLLNQIGIFNIENKNIHLEFLYVNNISYGNTYTSFRRYLNDFGYIGIVVLPFLEGYILSYFYKKARENRYKELDMKVLWYSTIAYCPFFYAYNGEFFSSIISYNYISLFIIMYLVSGIMSGRIICSGFKIKIKYNKGIRRNL